MKMEKTIIKFGNTEIKKHKSHQTYFNKKYILIK